MDKNQRNAVQAAADLLTAFLLDHVPNLEMWEDEYPQVDEARTILLEALVDTD